MFYVHMNKSLASQGRWSLNLDPAAFSLDLCSPEDGCGRLGAETGDLGAVGMTQAGHPMAGEAVSGRVALLLDDPSSHQNVFFFSF